MSCWFGDPIPWFGELAPDAPMASKEPSQQRARAAPALTVSLPGPAAMSLQAVGEAFDQSGSSEGLAQEANGSGLQRSSADALIGEGRYENERRTITLLAHKGQQVQARS
jgi:hypothetical protein